MNVYQAVASVFMKFGDFSGRASRREFWCWILVATLIGAPLLIIADFFWYIEWVNLMYTERRWWNGWFFPGLIKDILYLIVIVPPTLAVTSRRLHDTGRSGWSQMIVWIPFFPFMFAVGFIYNGMFRVFLDVMGGEKMGEYFLLWAEASEPFFLLMPLLVAGVMFLCALTIFIIWLAEDSKPNSNFYGDVPEEVLRYHSNISNRFDQTIQVDQIQKPICVNCHAVLRPGSSFCSKCGSNQTPQELLCRVCGTVASGQFCFMCGTKIEA